MNTRKHLTISLALTALALGLTTTQASAQEVLKGTFELPAAAYWGDTLLQPGQYSIWMSTQTRDLAVAQIHLSGERVTKTYMAISKPQGESGRNYLEIADIDGTYVVRALDAGPLGKSFTLGVTKNVRNKALRASAEPAIAVPVSTGAGS
jgi:hypothetical protein